MPRQVKRVLYSNVYANSEAHRSACSARGGRIAAVDDERGVFYCRANKLRVRKEGPRLPRRRKIGPSLPTVQEMKKILKKMGL